MVDSCSSNYHDYQKGLRFTKLLDARVAKLVDARDLKSLGGNTVPVRLRPRAPFLHFLFHKSRFLFGKPLFSGPLAMDGMYIASV